MSMDIYRYQVGIHNYINDFHQAELFAYLLCVIYCSYSYLIYCYI